MNIALAAEHNTLVLNWRTSRALLLQAALAAAAILLPAVCHLLSIPVHIFLPMHWPVLLAGLVYGWRGGLLVGLAAPLASFAFSGMPPLAALPYIGAEMAAYGFAAGFAREQFRLKSYAAVSIALIFGRLVYVLGFAAVTKFSSAPAWAVLGSGLAAALLQAILLPYLAGKWTGKPQR